MANLYLSKKRDNHSPESKENCEKRCSGCGNVLVVQDVVGHRGE